MNKDYLQLLNELEEPERYKGLVESQEPIRGTMSSEEFVRWQGENGERYRGLVESPEPIRGTMSSEEFVRWQGENGERYRGLVSSPEPIRGTMSSEEFIRWQGENGEIYRGMQPEDPDEYREKTTGTVDVEIAAEVTNLSKFAFDNIESIRKHIDIIEQDLACIPKLLELRTRVTFDFLFSWGDFNKNQLYTDLAIIFELQNRGYNFDGLSIDINNMLGGTPELVDINGLLSKYQEGMDKLGSKAKSARIPNPYDSSQQITMQDLMNMINNGLVLEKEDTGPKL